MEQIQPLISFVQAHWIDILALLGAIDLALGVISKWTPWAWDDNVYTLLHNLIAKIGKKP